MMIDDPSPSLEFDRFEDIRRVLADVLIADGLQLIEAEKIALYVVEGMRDMAKLTAMLAHSSSRTHQEILLTLLRVLDSAQAFDKARALLTKGDKLNGEG
jgi:hypothetical protein